MRSHAADTRLAAFESLKSTSPETARAKQIAAMPLPKPRKISLSKADKLAELIAASCIAPAGSRSEADFAVCCYAIRNGIAKEEVWSSSRAGGKIRRARTPLFRSYLGKRRIRYSGGDVRQAGKTHGCQRAAASVAVSRRA